MSTRGPDPASPVLHAGPCGLHACAPIMRPMQASCAPCGHHPASLPDEFVALGMGEMILTMAGCCAMDAATVIWVYLRTHQQRHRRKQSFRTLRCTALPVCMQKAPA